MGSYSSTCLNDFIHLIFLGFLHPYWGWCSYSQESYYPWRGSSNCPRLLRVLSGSGTSCGQWWDTAGFSLLPSSLISLVAASAWNDNGVKGLVKDSKALYRSDFFPGLGWMMPRSFIWISRWFILDGFGQNLNQSGPKHIGMTGSESRNIGRVATLYVRRSVAHSTLEKQESVMANTQRLVVVVVIQLTVSLVYWWDSTK